MRFSRHGCAQRLDKKRIIFNMLGAYADEVRSSVMSTSVQCTVRYVTDQFWGTCIIEKLILLAIVKLSTNHKTEITHV